MLKFINIVSLITLILGISPLIEANTFDVLIHSINKGKLHKSGRLEVQIVSKTESDFNVEIKYSLKKKSIYPIPDSVLNGSTDITLPIDFAHESGYIKLEEVGEIKVGKATVTFLKRVNYKNLYDCYQFQVTPKNGKWIGTFLYHPDVTSVGWVTSEITIKKIPIIGDYTMTSQMIEE